MKSHLLIAAAGILLGCSAAARADTEFSDILKSAMTTHPALASKRADVRSAIADKDAADWARFPTPSLEATSSSTSDVPPGALLRFDQPLWAGGRISGGSDYAKAQLDVAGSALEEARWNLTLQVISSYFEALRQMARVEHATNAVQEHQKLLEMIRRRVDQEVSSMVDQRFAESRLYQANSDQSQTAQALNTALTQLTQIAGMPVDAVTWRGLEEPMLPGTLDKAIEAAVNMSPTLQRLSHEVDSAQANITIRSAAYSPALLLRLERQTGSGLPNDTRASLVLQAQPGAGLSARSGVESAIGKLDSAIQAKESAVRDISQRVAIDWDDYVKASSRLRDAKLASQISSDVFDSYTRQYVIGRKSWIDVLNAVRETVQAQYAMDDAMSQARAAAFRLRLACGLLALEN